MNSALTRTAGLGLGLLLCTAPLAATATAATPTTLPHSAVGSAQQAAAKTAPRPALSAKATVKSVKAWQEFRVYGSSTRMAAGTRVTLQQLQRKGWVSLPIHMNTTRSHAYNLRVKLGIKGLNKIRIVGGGAVSNTVQVTIR
ncbi:hypothetical protein [Streptomyces longispororuber]|uniref:hypothetical protein n=1 Tax=Streptomyces longispororuber TaxID=68230 RepID=UPI00210AE2DB|nr:hypothetical protein [Streptomyces longispororuber]MCQ4210876.1 hypothetical protein [Streptomyces longispororuber]